MKNTKAALSSFWLMAVCWLLTSSFDPSMALAKPEGSVAPKAPVYAQTFDQDPETAALSEALVAARQAGDQNRVRDLCAKLGWVQETAPDQGSKNSGDFPQIVHRPELENQSNLTGTDIQVNIPDWQSNNPAMASTRDGVLYLAVDDVRPEQYYIDLYSSENDGYTWGYLFSIVGVNDLTQPSIAIGEGDVNRLLIAYESGRNTPDAAIFVLSLDLDTGITHQVAVESYPYWISNPQICVDSSHYSNWWPYLTYTKGLITKDNKYNLIFTRSLDFGETWESPRELATDIASDCKPDIDFGFPGLYVAFTRYTASNLTDVTLLRSLDLGSTWDPELALAQSPRDETDPRVAATKGGGTVVVAFTTEYQSDNTDVEAYISQDSGDSWNPNYLPWTPGREAKVDLDVSPELGRIHAAFWSENNIHYTWSSWDSPGIWAPIEVMTDQGSAAIGVRPTVTVDPNKVNEGCVAWTDTRIELQYHIFFDATYPLGDYLVVVANPSLIAAVQPLVLWKELLGYNISVVDLATIFSEEPGGDDAQRIWSYLHQRHQLLKYVMLVGDVDLLPMRILYPDGDPAYPASDPRHHTGLGYGTDYYYAEHSMVTWDQDGDDRWGEFSDDAFDFNPELIVGRLPFNDPTPVQAICSNIVTFEQDTGAWKRNTLLAHGFVSQAQGPNQPASDTGSVADFMVSNLLQPRGWSATTLLEREGLAPSVFNSTAGLDQNNFESYCGPQSFGLVNCSAHGNESSFAGVRWSHDLNESGYCDLFEELGWNIFSLQERIAAHPTQSFIYLNGCNSAPILGRDLDFNSSPLRSRYLIRNTRPDTNVKDYLLSGAAGLIGSSAGSEATLVWNSPADGGAASLAYYFYENVIDGRMPAGDAFFKAEQSYAQIHGLSRAMRVFNFFGDPSLLIEGTAPDTAPEALAARSIPGHLDPEMALATAQDWQRKATGRQDSNDHPLVYGEKSQNEATIWTECAQLPDCLVITSLIRSRNGPVLGTAIASDGSGGSKGVLLSSSDGWDPWQTSYIEGLLSARTFFETHDGTFLVGGLAGTLPSNLHGVIYRTTDGFENWHEQLQIPGGLVTDIFQDRDGTLWATSALNGQIFQSADDGQTWTLKVTFSGGPDISSMMQASSGRYFLTLTSANWMSILFSDDADIWSVVPGLGDVQSAYQIIEAGGRLYAGVAESAGCGVYQAQDLDGASWSRVDDFPFIDGSEAVCSLAVDLAGNVFAGISMNQTLNTTTVLAMDPNDETWHAFGGGVDMANQVTALLPLSGRVFIGTGSFYGKIYRVAGQALSGVPDPGQTPSNTFTMDQNYPNPFNPTTTVAFQLPATVAVNLRLYDLQGRLVRNLLSGEVLSLGRHEAVWDGRDDTGRRVSSGTYFYRLEAGEYNETKRMVLVK